MAITAAMVKDLRDKTGAGMVDCKKALDESNGDVEKAVEWLRKKGLANANKKSDRVTAEGVVATHVADNCAVILEMNCETDFVAKNDAFKALVSEIISLVEKNNPATVEALNGLKTSSGATVEERVKETIAKIGENMQVRRFKRFDISADQAYGTYIHNAGRIGVLVGAKFSGVKAADVAELLKDLAMHVCASPVVPVGLAESDIPAEAIAKEREIYIAKAKESGKPDNMIEKIIAGQISKYVSEVCLLSQKFIKNPDLTIAKLVEAKGKELGGKVEITGFVRFALGEGIEKVESNFAEEVRKTLGQ